MPKESNLEFKVGLFMLVALVALGIFIFSVSDSSVLEKGQTLQVVFRFANGVKKNAPVRIAGVEEGLVKDVRLFFDRSDSTTKVMVELGIKRDTQIPADSVVTVNQLGMMGEKYIEIFPGVETKQFLTEDQVIAGKDPIAQEAISQRVMDVSNKIDHAIAGINRFVSDEENIESINATLKNLSSITGSLDGMFEDIRKGRGTIGKLMYDDRLYEDLEGFTADLKENPWKLLYRPKQRKKE